MAKTFSLDDTMEQLSEALGFGAIMDPKDYPSTANDYRGSRSIDICFCTKVFVRDDNDKYYLGFIDISNTDGTYDVRVDEDESCENLEKVPLEDLILRSANPDGGFNKEKVKQIFEGADKTQLKEICTYKSSSGKTVLHWLCMKYASINIIKKVLKTLGAEVACQLCDNNQEFPLHLAAEYNASAKVIAKLLEASSSLEDHKRPVNMSNICGEFPLDLAKSSGSSKKVVNMLVDASLKTSISSQETKGLEETISALRNPNMRNLTCELSRGIPECSKGYHGASKEPYESQPHLQKDIDGIQQIAEELKKESCNVRILDLSKCGVYNEGAKFLADSLKHPNCKLTSLWLSFCHIYSDGLKALALALTYKTCKLKRLNLQENCKNAGWNCEDLMTHALALKCVPMTAVYGVQLKTPDVGVWSISKDVEKIQSVPYDKRNESIMQHFESIRSEKSGLPPLRFAIHHSLGLLKQKLEIGSLETVKTILQHEPESSLDEDGKLALSIFCDDPDQAKNPTEVYFQWCKTLYFGTLPNAKDALGKNRDDLVRFSTNHLVRKWAKTLGTYLGRYKIDSGKSVHKSKTCRVVFASDLGSTEDNDENNNKGEADAGETKTETSSSIGTTSTVATKTRVALKIMKNYDEFRREIISRYGTSSEPLDDCTIGLIGWHISNDTKSISLNELRESHERSERTDSQEQEEYVLVMEMGSASLFHEMTSQRIAGHDVDKVQTIFKKIVQQVQRLHGHNLIHSDIKPRNILFVPSANFEDENITLCDLDAALEIGTERPFDLKSSTAYCPPEFAQFKFAQGPAPIMTAKFDIWSLGVLLFELCSGQNMFFQDISDDNMTSELDVKRLCLWNCITDQELLLVFDDNKEAKDLIRWCLRGDPTERPTIEQILQHPFVTGVQDDTLLKQRMSYHAFISHMQIEASGNVGTMFFILEQLGCHGWRDMNQDDLTEAGMKQGVEDSDVFILFLTNSVLSRPFCLKEIGWALDANKPIVIVAEEEERFWPFDIERWKNDICTKDTTVWPHVWKKSGGLGSNYASCPANIKAEIQRQHDAGLILPYRRRDFEANAMMTQILKCAGEPSHHRLPHIDCGWAKHVPAKDALKWDKISGITSTKGKNVRSQKRKLLFVCDKNYNEMSKKIASEIEDDLRSRGVQILPESRESEATHALVILTGSLLSRCPTVFDTVIQHLHPSKVVYVYSRDTGWEFGAFYQQDDSSFKTSVGGHEALVLRALEYEKEAMMKEILRRLRPTVIKKKVEKNRKISNDARRALAAHRAAQGGGRRRVSSRGPAKKATPSKESPKKMSNSARKAIALARAQRDYDSDDSDDYDDKPGETKTESPSTGTCIAPPPPLPGESKTEQARRN